MRIYRQIPLYRFLEFCLKMIEPRDRTEGVSARVLDCGAGGNLPPLALFQSAGFKTAGIEIDPYNLERARDFEASEGISLGIVSGDMRTLEFPDASFEAVYSYNAVFHMTKADMRRSVGDMARVLKPGGLLFVNFLSTEDQFCGEGEAVGPGEFLQEEGEDRIIHSYLNPDEAEGWFADIGGLNPVFKETRHVERAYEGEWIHQVYMDYHLQKK